MHKRGRPPSLAEPRTAKIGIRFHPDEVAVVERAASVAKMSPAEWVRTVAIIAAGSSALPEQLERLPSVPELSLGSWPEATSPEDEQCRTDCHRLVLHAYSRDRFRRVNVYAVPALDVTRVARLPQGRLELRMRGDVAPVFCSNYAEVKTFLQFRFSDLFPIEAT